MARIRPAVEFERTARPGVSLDGIWAFSYDPNGVGVKERWFDPSFDLPERTRVPGCAQAKWHASSGTEKPSTGLTVYDVTCLEKLRTPLLKYPCMAPAWFKRTFTVPAGWQGKAAWLHVGGVKPAAELWINGVRLGRTRTSRSPVRCDLTRHINFGGRNSLAVRVYWPWVRLDGVWDVLWAWSGIYRSIRVESVGSAFFEDVRVLGTVNPSGAKLSLGVRSRRRRTKCLGADVTISGPADGRMYHGECSVSMNGGEDGGSLEIPMPRARLWSPEEPNLYQTEVRLHDGEELLDSAVVRFGLRQVRTRGRQVLVNGKPVILRGGCDVHEYPRTVCPPASKDFFLKRLRAVKAYGFNYAKNVVEPFTREDLDAADEVGIMVCQEMPFGAAHGERQQRVIRDDPPDSFVKLYHEQLANIVRADRSHPCVVLYSMASELNGGEMTRRSFRVFCRDLPAATRRLNPNALVFDATHIQPGIKTRRMKFGMRDTDLIECCCSGVLRQCPLTGPMRGLEEVNLPFVLHEYNWLSALPDPEIAKRYRSLPMKATGVPEMRQAAAASGLTRLVPRFVENSRKLKWRLQKCALEVARKHPAVTGYHFWVVQGTEYCPEGIFNDFWEAPEETPAEEFRTFNGDTVLLLDDGDQRCFVSGTRAPLGIEVSHFGSQPLGRPLLTWRLKRGKRTVAHGSERLRPIRCGFLGRVVKLRVKMPSGARPAKLEFVCELSDRGRVVCWNHWNLWVFPPRDTRPRFQNVRTDLPFLANAYPEMEGSGARVLATDALDDSALNGLAQGQRVLLLSRDALKICSAHYDSCYRSVPYNSGWEGNMGTVIAPHPALGAFPHEGWCDLPFARMIQDTYPIDLSVFRPLRIQPIIRSIGHYRTMRDKAYLFEIGVGKGTLLACSLKIREEYEASPAARYLADRMLAYLAGGRCAPSVRIRPGLGKKWPEALLQKRL